MSLELTGKHADPHNGTIYADDPHYIDFGGYWVDKHAVTVDHVIDDDGEIACRVNGSDLENLP